MPYLHATPSRPYSASRRRGLLRGQQSTATRAGVAAAHETFPRFRPRPGNAWLPLGACIHLLFGPRTPAVRYWGAIKKQSRVRQGATSPRALHRQGAAGAPMSIWLGDISAASTGLMTNTNRIQLSYRHASRCACSARDVRTVVRRRALGVVRARPARRRSAPFGRGSKAARRRLAANANHAAPAAASWREGRRAARASTPSSSSTSSPQTDLKLIIRAGVVHLKGPGGPAGGWGTMLCAFKFESLVRF